jgi:hypothetical protein
MTNPLQDLLAGGARSFKFEMIGSSVTGTVVSADLIHKRDFDNNEPQFWADGSPQQLIRITLQTNLRDASDPEDDGKRAVYVKAWGDQLSELRRAMKAARAVEPTKGGQFTATYVRDGEGSGRGLPPKVYEYRYIRPDGVGSVIANGQQQQPQGTTWGTATTTYTTPPEWAAQQPQQAAQQPQEPPYVPPQPQPSYAPQNAAQQQPQPQSSQLPPNVDPAQLAAFEAWQRSQQPQ